MRWKVSKSQLWTLKPHFCKNIFIVKMMVCVRQALVRLPLVVRTLHVCAVYLSVYTVSGLYCNWMHLSALKYVTLDWFTH